MARKPTPKSATEPATPAEGLRRTAAPSSGKTYRVKSASEFADLLGVSRATVSKWIRDGMPTEGDEPAPGKPYLIDIGVAVRWLQGRAAAEAKSDAEEAGGGGGGLLLPGDGGESYEDAKTRKERALANAAESDAEIKAIAAAEKRGEVGPWSTMTDTVRQEYGKLASKLSEVGRLVEIKLKNGTPERIGREVDAMIRMAMENNLRCDVGRAMEVDDTPTVEPHVGP